jgi:hypothetical protein
MKIRQPDEMQDMLAFIHAYAPDYLPRHETTNPQMFAEVFEGMEYLKGKTPTAEGKEALQQCIRNLGVAYEDFEHRHTNRASRTVEETAEMFRKARRYIDTDD